MHRPIELTYPILTMVAKMAHDKIVHRQWNSTTAEVFLKTHCFSHAMTQLILTHADNCLQYEIAMANTDDQETRNLFIAEKKVRPKAFSMATLPPFFNSTLELEHFVDPPLHLLALGCMKTTVKLIDIWISNRGRKSQFLKLVRPDLYHLKSLDLDWCEVVPKPFGNKYGGYISNNYMALVRLSPWLYSSILVLSQPEPYEEPSTPVSTWRTVDCRGFLRLRGLPTPRYVEDMRKAVVSR